MKLLTTTTAINAAIVAVTASGKKWENDVQVLALSIIAHSAKHREASLLDSLLGAMPKGSRTNALIGYFDKFSCCTYIEKVGAKAAHFSFDKDKKADMAGAQETTWAKFIPEKPYVPMDLCALLTKLVTRAEKDTETEYSPALLEGIKALVADNA